MVLLQRCIVFLSLAVSSTWSWPQLDSGRAHAPSLPFVPRSLPVLDDTGAGATLHILQPDRPSPPAGGGESLATLPLGSTKRTLPVNDGLPGTLTLPVLRAPKPGLVSRNLEVKLENRSDVAYYAQRKKPKAPTPGGEAPSLLTLAQYSSAPRLSPSTPSSTPALTSSGSTRTARPSPRRPTRPSAAPWDTTTQTTRQPRVTRARVAS